jgi:hypothetical protein
MTVRVVECVRCGESSIFDSWPYDGDASDALDQLIRSEEWTFQGGDEYCPDCSGGDDD